jgi:hypothetical protein
MRQLSEHDNRPRRRWLLPATVVALTIVALRHGERVRRRRWIEKDIVDESSEQSFPASDPPQFALGVETKRSSR